MSDATKRLQDYDIELRHEATVVSNVRLTTPAAADEVREIVIQVQRPEFAYRVGQSIGVLAPGAPEFGQTDHFRLYSVADLPARGATGLPRVTLCVKRCFYLDAHSGERYPGVASNYLCDLRPGDTLTITGPYDPPFEIPEDHTANLILIGSGTGIAPFRALVKHLYREVPDWQGRVWLFHGARSGLELLYMNDERDDFAQYCDRSTFEAIRALSPRPSWADAIPWDAALVERGAELWRMLGDPRTHVFVAGLEPMRDELDRVFSGLAGSAERWRRRKAELAAGGRWVELLY